MCKQKTETTKIVPRWIDNSETNAFTVDRPLVSFVVFAYNQEKYIREAVEGAFAQTYTPLEIFISDDCSNDTTFKIILELVDSYIGPHKVIVQRNESNLGLAEHISTVMRCVNGELIVAAAGDDISYSNRTERVAEQWLNNNKESGSIFSLADTISQHGHVISHKTNNVTLKYDLQDRPAEFVQSLGRGTLGCAHAWTKDVFNIFGELDRRIIQEDISIPLRSMMLGSVTFIQEDLVLYRLNDDTLSRISYKNSRERSLKMQKYWAGRVANYEQFDRDMTCALNQQIVKMNDANWMRSIVVRERDLALLNYVFFSGGVFTRIIAILTSSRKVSVGRKMKLMLLALFPWLYNFKAPKFLSQ